MEGQSLEDLFRGRNLDMEAMYLNMKALMDEEDLPYKRRTHTYNSRLAQELAKWAEMQPQGEAIHAALYKAFFIDGQNLADRDVLLNAVKSIGLDTQAAATVIDERTYSSAVDEDWSLSRSYGVTGVPTFVADGRGVVGAQQYEVLQRLVEVAGAQPRSA